MKIGNYRGNPKLRRLWDFSEALPNRFEGKQAIQIYQNTFFACKDTAFRDLAALVEIGWVTKNIHLTDRRKNIYAKV